MKTRKQKRILIVDDDIAITEALQLALTVFNFKVSFINVGSELNSAIKSFSPDLLLVDFFLSGESGIDLVKSLKDNQKNSDLKIIMFSAHPSAKNQIQDLNIQGFVTKPFDIHILVKKINSVLT